MKTELGFNAAHAETLRTVLPDAVSDDDSPLNYTALRGFLFAVVTAPDLYNPSEVLPWIFQEGDDEPVFEDESSVGRFMSALMSLWNDMVDRTEDEDFSLEWLIGADVVDDALVHDWSFGFARGSRLVGESWHDAVPPTDLGEDDEGYDVVEERDADDDSNVVDKDENTEGEDDRADEDEAEVENGGVDQDNAENEIDVFEEDDDEEPTLHDLINFYRLDLMILGDTPFREALFEGNKEAEAVVMKRARAQFLESARELASWGHAFAEASVDNPGDERIYHPTEPIRKDPEPGRNDPCPCGSGKKYKKCCLH